jgi:hypothetical protein
VALLKYAKAWLASLQMHLDTLHGVSSAEHGWKRVGSVRQRDGRLHSMLEASGALTFAVNEPQFELLPPAAGDCEPGVTSLVDGQICRIRVGFGGARWMRPCRWIAVRVPTSAA